MKFMVDLTTVMLSQDGTKSAHDSKKIVSQRDSGASQGEEFNKLFKQSIDKVAMPESGIKKPESGDILPNNPSPLITLGNKTLRGGMLLLVGGDEPTNDVIEEFAQSHGVEAELRALLMKGIPSAYEREQPAPNLAQQISLLSSEKPSGQEKTPREAELLVGAVKEATKQNAVLTATPSKFIASESILAKGSVAQPQPAHTLHSLSQPLNPENSQLGEEYDDGMVIHAKNAGSLVTLVDAAGKRTSIERPLVQQISLLSSEKPSGQEKTPREAELLVGAVKEATKQNAVLTATPSKFIASESILAKGPVAQPAHTLHSLSQPLNPENSQSGEEYDDGMVIHAKNAGSLVTLVDAAGKRTSIERPDEVLIIKQEQHADMSRRLAEALGQRLTAQISKGVWQVELDIHPKSLGRIEIHLEMRGGELEAHFNASKALTRELLQDGMPRLKEELREHGIKIAYLGLGSGNQGANDGNSTPSGNQDDGDETELRAKTNALEPKVGVAKQQTLTYGLDVTI
jgi:flagellar hook-length control protein FliK